jgi:hypothetical protein
MFLWCHSRPLFEAVHDLLVNQRYRKDELALTDLTKQPAFADRFAALDYSYNLGDTDFELRYQLAQKPIKVVHFHPDRPAVLARFLDGRNGLGVSPLTERFVGLLHRHGFGRAAPRPFGAAEAGASPF